jgi:hypothetical protein
MEADKMNETMDQLSVSLDNITAFSTIVADDKFDAGQRLEDLRTWHNEWLHWDKEMQKYKLSLDKNSYMGQQRRTQAERLRKRAEVFLQLQKPLELSQSLLDDPTGYRNLRNSLVLNFARWSKEDRLLWLENLRFIMTPDLRLLQARIDHIIDCNRRGYQRNFLLGADTGMGKTTYCDYLVMTHPPVVGPYCNICRILKISAPVNNLTGRTLLQRCLVELGLVYTKGATEEELLHKLIDNMPDCGVELVIVDECEHITTPSLRRRLLEISNETHGVPIICTSCNPEKWVEGDPEVAGRWRDNLRLHPFTEERLRNLLTFVELLLPFSKDSYLDLEEIPVAGGKCMPGPAAFIQQWTGGNLRELMFLIFDAASRAIRTGQSHISLELLTQVHGEVPKIDERSPKSPQRDDDHDE